MLIVVKIAEVWAGRASLAINVGVSDNYELQGCK